MYKKVLLRRKQEGTDSRNEESKGHIQYSHLYSCRVFLGITRKQSLSHQSNLGLSFQYSHLWELSATAVRLFTAQKIK